MLANDRLTGSREVGDQACPLTQSRSMASLIAMRVLSSRQSTRVRLGCVAFAIGCVWALASTAAQASTVTIGSPLTGAYFSSSLGVVTVTNTALPEPGAHVTSPVTGTIVRWRIMLAFGGPFKLRVLTPGSATAYTGGAASAPQSPVGPGIETFTTSLPIQAGQTIGLDDTNTSDTVGNSEFFTGTGSAVWKPPLGIGETRESFATFGNEISFNADVQPPPGIVSISPAAGSTTGGTSVVITGHDFTGASAVEFGATPASSYTVDSDTQIAAVSPPISHTGIVDVSVTTAAGTTPEAASDRFSYVVADTGVGHLHRRPCVVPKLKGKSLKADRKKLKKAGCKLGKVRGEKSKSAKVRQQSPKPGKILAPGSKVNVRLGG
jgi:hypothetical protein